MQFTLESTDPSGARAGFLETSHGRIETPIFMPVGTVGTVKAVWPRELESDINADIILGNTYHLYLRPGMEVMEAAGGLHAFQGWNRPILTDSGGYQVFSLAERRKLTEEGVRFQSHIDGSYHQFTPESVVDIQRSIGSDIMMVLDECPPGDATETYAANSNELTVRWAERCMKQFNATTPLYGHDQSLFGIVQGVVYPEIRRRSARQLVDLNFPGYAIGGLSVGEPAEQMYAMVDVVTEVLPASKPRYLMGVGTPANLVENVHRGIDMFDCVMPTRNGRNGNIFTTEGIINIRNKKWQRDFSEIDPGLDKYASRHFSKAYLRHLFIAKEVLGLQIASVQNLTFYLWLMREARKAIVRNEFASWKAEIMPRIERRL
ncbi:MAG: tRNA guanosine(34) transglycosylase Tgt [Bacteroidetes Order II. Incertae sedis bacterium]|jgi:queuine tRNA-ribosyltransferase|nr:tRNA guanosine(34) transglycosylase Tgt [Bacteroidetes Order II. bacterium]MBT6425281.1 tRNA guanosine(34) transglycosylase Tgt [Bacteroidetes Order II. bacterium]MBT6598684.1 tRNA guanosine(34) transglycosylase Tgt [Bacteroidetes Order II. bacterium]MBT7400384.1 tRNA guanosine(34) transglycosylase Tgt [Bacteroidetes Order II. bacterium]